MTDAVRRGLRAGAALAVCACLGGVPALAEPVSQTALDRWLFHDNSDAYLVGDRILKHAVPVSVALGAYRGGNPYEKPASAKLEAALLPILDAVEAGTPLAGTEVEGVVPYRYGRIWEMQGIALFAVDTNPPFLDGRPLAGYEAVAAAAEDLGCETYLEVPYAARHPSLPERERVWSLRYAVVSVDPALPPERYQDCLFRSLLIALGLHHTERLAFDPAPLTPAERAEALSVLALVYHPRVESGMTRAEFLEVLRAEGLVAE